MSRLRFIVDRPRGARGGHNDERYLFKSLSSAKMSADAKKGVEYNGRLFRPDRPTGRILTVDLDDLLVVDAPVDEAWIHHERAILRHGSEMHRLRPYAEGAEGAYLTPEDMAQLREVVSEWDAEEDRLRRGGGATPAARGAYFLLRDLWRAGKLGGPR